MTSQGLLVSEVRARVSFTLTFIDECLWGTGNQRVVALQTSEEGAGRKQEQEIIGRRHHA